MTQLRERVRRIIPTLQNSQQLQLIISQSNDLATLQSLGIQHGSTVSAVVSVMGGSDPRIKMLIECPNKNVSGIQSPSLRACPHCGALVQHTDACKNMKCPACQKDFCFVCLSKNGGYNCGNCKPAVRQTRIPGAG